jgi:hypothetical protein
MKKAIRIWDGVERLSCSAHTLQLTVIKALKIIKPHTKRIRKLVKFFRSSKQSQRLDQAQIDLAQRNKSNISPIQLYDNPADEIELEEPDDESDKDKDEDNNDNIERAEFKILRTINDVKTRWNSSYQSWQRLLVLRPAIEWLSATLHLNHGDDSANEDSRKLKDCMLQNCEWQLLEDLVKLLKPFDELTTYFSGIQYTTLSVVNPSIEALKFEFSDGTLLTLEEFEEVINDDNLVDEGKYKLNLNINVIILFIN